MRLETLISCMHQNDESIAKKSNVRNDAIIINQCDKNEIFRKGLISDNGKPQQITMVCTTERGLSRSRNMAIAYATADICLIADDDELFKDNAAENILKAYEEHPEADLITFKVEGSISSHKKYAQSVNKIGYLKALHISSVQITFRRQRIVEKKIEFDPEMGSGSGHGCGEEAKFLYDCLHKGLRIVHVPITIASLVEGSESQWFTGRTPRFFVNRGWATARYLGKPIATVYAFYYAWAKRAEYKSETTIFQALKSMLYGIYHKNI